MGLPVSVKVNFRGNVKRFVAQDRDKLDWESVEAWIKASFGINHFQVKYFDEDNEEICINSQDEYEEAIKSAEKQGNQLHMNVYKMKGQACGGGGALKTEVKELKGDLRPAPPYPSRVKTVDKGTQVTPEREAPATVKDNKGNKAEDEPPPMWFRSYMEKFKDEVVKEVVERMCSDFSGQCCTHKSSEDPPEAEGAVGGPIGPIGLIGPIGPRPGPSGSSGSLGYTPNCSSCNKLTTEGAYKCSVCPSCILCELCRHSHDPSHSLIRTKTPLSIPEHGMTGETRFPRRGDRTVRKAERQRLKAERRQLRAEVKEIKKKLRLEKRGLQWSGPSTSGTASAATQAPPPPSGPAPAPEPQASSPEAPGAALPTMAALFLDENLPDGTRLEPDTKFIKYWKMKNSGSATWTSETKLVFMWGNLGLASEERRSVPAPLLQPGQVGVVSVALVAPLTEGTFTSHWRLAHSGVQFGPRIWCSITVDANDGRATNRYHSKRRKEEDLTHTDSLTHFEDYFFPSVDLLTAQDLLSFELLDINIVQELEKVPNNTPVALTPCISPLPHDAPGSERPVDTRVKDDTEVTGVRKLFALSFPAAGVKLSPCLEASDLVGQEEEREEEISGAQFLCETLIRSLTLEEPSDHRPPRRIRHGGQKPAGERPLCSQEENQEALAPPTNTEPHQEEEKKLTDQTGSDSVLDGAESGELPEERPIRGEEWDEVSSQTSSISSCEDFIIVLPDCFDTSRPLGDSMYSSATSQPDDAAAVIQPTAVTEDCSMTPTPEEEEEPVEEDELAEEEPAEEEEPMDSSSVNQMLCASQTLDAVTLTPEVVTLPPPPTLYSPRSEALYLAESPSPPGCEPNPPQVHLNVSSGLSRSAGSASSAFETYNPRPSFALQPRGPGGITEGLVKGALSVAASAYKALFTGPNCSIQRGIVPTANQDPSMMSVLMEMGFRDQRLNQRLLRKHGYSLLRTVNELVQRAEDAKQPA